jgi:hypothetical protein
MVKLHQAQGERHSHKNGGWPNEPWQTTKRGGKEFEDWEGAMMPKAQHSLF